MTQFPFQNIWGSPLLNYPTPPVLAYVQDGIRATSAGALQRAGALFVLTGIVMALVWARYLPAARAVDMSVLNPLTQAVFACGVIAMSLVFVGRYKVHWLPVLAPAYCVFAGLFLAGLSLKAEADFPGIALNTVIATAAVFTVMAIGYRLRWFNPTARFRAALFSVTAGIALVYLAAFGLSLIGVRILFIHETGWGAILWTGFICSIAAMHLLVDFAAIERLDHYARSRYMEWYAALGLMVTLVWLYLLNVWIRSSPQPSTRFRTITGSSRSGCLKLR